MLGERASPSFGLREKGLGYWTPGGGEEHWGPGLNGTLTRGCWRPQFLGTGLVLGVRPVLERVVGGEAWGPDLLVSGEEKSAGKSNKGELKFLPFPCITFTFFRGQFSFNSFIT